MLRSNFSRTVALLCYPQHTQWWPKCNYFRWILNIRAARIGRYNRVPHFEFHDAECHHQRHYCRSFTLTPKHCPTPLYTQIHREYKFICYELHCFLPSRYLCHRWQSVICFTRRSCVSYTFGFCSFHSSNFHDHHFCSTSPTLNLLFPPLPFTTVDDVVFVKD